MGAGVCGIECRIWGVGFRVSGIGCRIWGYECGVSDLGFRVSDLRCTAASPPCSRRVKTPQRSPLLLLTPLLAPAHSKTVKSDSKTVKSVSKTVRASAR